MLVGKIEEQINDCKKKIKNELKISMGIVKAKNKVKSSDYCDKWCYFGIKLIEDKNKEPEY